MPDSREPLRFAVIGCGQIGRMHIRRLHADGRARAVALHDTRESAVRKAGSEHAPTADLFHGGDGVKPMLDRCDLDAVIVCSPTRFHAEQVRLCRQRGLPVLCEKPLAETRERILQLIEESQSGPLLSVAYQRRSWPVYRTLRREVHSGRWGPVRAVTAHNVENWQPGIAGTWRDDPEINPGGFIGDAGSHKIDALFYVTGLKPTEVFAHCDRCGSRVEICATVSARLEGEVPVGMDFIGNAHYLTEDLHVHCAEADLMVRDGRMFLARDGRVEPFADLEPLGRRDVGLPQPDGTERQVGPVSHWPDRPPEPVSNPDSCFLEMLLNDGPNLAPAACALPVVDFTHALLQSGKTGRPVRIGSQ